MIKVGLISLGCAKNLVDSEHMLARMKEKGMALVEDVAQADIAVINTCGFIEAAKAEAIEQILEVVALKNQGDVKGIVVTGCLTQRYKDEFFDQLPEVDAILGTGSYEDIVEAVEQAYAGKRFSKFGDINRAESEGDRVLATPSYTAFLKIAEGCDNRCAYCVIPSLRGDYRSRRMEDLLAEAKQLADRGVKELIVIAQDITRYGLDLYGKRCLSDLARGLCKLPFTWVRLHYLYPDEITDELIETIAGEEKIVKYLDIPIQHASSRILGDMKRRGDRAFLSSLFNRLREKISGLVLRTSLIVGFPGETDEDFTELCEFLKEQKIERAGVFCYSNEEGSEAFSREDQIDEDVKSRRQFIAEEIQSRVMDGYNEGLLGQVLLVLTEGYDDFTKQSFGRSYADSPDIDGKVFFTAEERPSIGDFVKVRLTQSSDGDLQGERV